MDRAQTFARAAVATLVVVVAVAASTRRARAQSGFVRDQGSLYTQLAFHSFSSHDFYDLDGNLQDRGEVFTQHYLKLYAEYGIWGGLTAIADLPLLRLNSYANTDQVAGFGDIRLGLKWGLELLTIHLAATVLFEIPTGDSEASVRTPTGANLILPTGDGELNVWSYLGLSRSFAAIRSYASIYVGYNLRTKSFSDQVAVGGQLGYNLLGWVDIAARMHGQLGPVDKSAPGGFLFGEGSRYVSFGVAVAGRIPYVPLKLRLELEHAFAAQRNIYSGTTFGVALAFEHDFIAAR